MAGELNLRNSINDYYLCITNRPETGFSSRWINLRIPRSDVLISADYMSWLIVLDTTSLLYFPITEYKRSKVGLATLGRSWHTLAEQHQRLLPLQQIGLIMVCAGPVFLAVSGLEDCDGWKEPTHRILHAKHNVM